MVQTDLSMTPFIGVVIHNPEVGLSLILSTIACCIFNHINEKSVGTKITESSKLLHGAHDQCPLTLSLLLGLILQL